MLSLMQRPGSNAQFLDINAPGRGLAQAWPSETEWHPQDNNVIGAGRLYNLLLLFWTEAVI